MLNFNSNQDFYTLRPVINPGFEKVYGKFAAFKSAVVAAFVSNNGTSRPSGFTEETNSACFRARISEAKTSKEVHMIAAEEFNCLIAK